jgi:hypothetical protein
MANIEKLKKSWFLLAVGLSRYTTRLLPPLTILKYFDFQFKCIIYRRLSAALRCDCNRQKSRRQSMVSIQSSALSRKTMRMKLNYVSLFSLYFD